MDFNNYSFCILLSHLKSSIWCKKKFKQLAVLMLQVYAQKKVLIIFINVWITMVKIEVIIIDIFYFNLLNFYHRIRFRFTFLKDGWSQEQNRFNIHCKSISSHIFDPTLRHKRQFHLHYHAIHSLHAPPVTTQSATTPIHTHTLVLLVKLKNKNFHLLETPSLP